MPNKLNEVLSGKEANYILPFFWQHGEDEVVLREEMARIYESGIGAVCVEARPHPDFLGPRWWKDMDVIIEEAGARGMRVWVLDDDHFPTGHAAGRLKDAPHDLRRVFLSKLHIDAIGPKRNSSFLVAVPHLPGVYEAGSSNLIVIAVKRDSVTGELMDETLELTSHVVKGRLYWDVPDGCWRIFSIFENATGGDPSKRDYLNPLIGESTKVLIDTVYEAFYTRYREYFGDTFAGFFSDEPGFYSGKSAVITNFDITVGQDKADLPWCPELGRLLEEELGADYKTLLPLLWQTGGKERTSKIRYCYMDLVSSLYAKHFTTQIGDWCRERNVEYIGHVIEDNNTHSRLGPGSGHFFRSLGGQDMSGLDVVLWQLNPGFDEIPSAWVAGEADNEFFNYGLAKMAASLAHLDPKKKGRTVAEVFGAYGWVEGLKLMKWMTDHMLVRGVNHFVPHAFSPKEFPDPDCPPHMYARGQNPQYRYYKYLNDYTNRMSHLLTGGIHVASAAVLYHAEAEWSGHYMYFHKPVKELMRAQIDCDVVSCDFILEDASVHNGKLIILNESYDCLIVPYSEALPVEMLQKFTELTKNGLPIYFVDGLPARTSEGGSEEYLEQLKRITQVQTIALGDLAQKLQDSGFREILTEGSHPYLRYHHVRQQDMEVYMFFNEHPIKEIHTEIILPIKDAALFYDAYTNTVSHSGGVREGDSTRILLELAPFESIVVLSSAGLEAIATAPSLKVQGAVFPVETLWSIATAVSEQYPNFIPWAEYQKLTDLSQPGLLESFSGTFRYETSFNYDGKSQQRLILDLGEVFETAEVFINGTSVGVRISSPYLFDVGEIIYPGENYLVVEVTNTLAKRITDFFSRVAQHEPSGLLGPVRLIAQ